MFLRTETKSGQEGQSIVETALMIPVVLLLLMGIIEFGFLFYAHVRVSNAAREGARAGSLWLIHREATAHYYDPILCDTVHDAVQSEFSAVEHDDILITLKEGVVDCDLGDADLAPLAGEPVTVTLVYDYTLPVTSGLPIIRDVISSPFPVSRLVVMRFQ